MSKLEDLTRVLRHPPRPCPVKGFPLALKDLTFDGYEQYSVVISAQDFSQTRYSDFDRMAIAQWLNEYLLPELNKYALVTISKVEKSLSDIDGWENVEREVN